MRRRERSFFGPASHVEAARFAVYRSRMIGYEKSPDGGDVGLADWRREEIHVGWNAVLVAILAPRWAK